MPIKIGEVEALFRDPVKSMSGEPLEVADLGWHGLDGDRRLAFRRLDDRGGFPWLSASKLPELILFAPQRRESEAGGGLPTHVCTPEGDELDLLVTLVDLYEKKHFAIEAPEPVQAIRFRMAFSID